MLTLASAEPERAVRTRCPMHRLLAVSHRPAAPGAGLPGSAVRWSGVVGYVRVDWRADRRGAQSGRRRAAASASHIRWPFAGMSMWRTPRWDTASITAL